jgi:cell wall-associated NlpC family hydrolase
MTTRAQVIAEARTWVGTPYQHQARLKSVAVDCIGIVIGTARELGLVARDFDINGYSRQPDGTLIETAGRYMTRITQDEMQPGDVVAVAFDKDPQHFGILVDYRHGGLAIVHASTTYAKVIETRLLFGTAPQTMKFVAAYRLPGIA